MKVRQVVGLIQSYKLHEKKKTHYKHGVYTHNVLVVVIFAKFKCPLNL